MSFADDSGSVPQLIDMFFPEATILTVGDVISEHDKFVFSRSGDPGRTVRYISVRTRPSSVVDIAADMEIAKGRFSLRLEGDRRSAREGERVRVPRTRANRVEDAIVYDENDLSVVDGETNESGFIERCDRPFHGVYALFVSVFDMDFAPLRSKKKRKRA